MAALRRLCGCLMMIFARPRLFSCWWLTAPIRRFATRKGRRLPIWLRNADCIKRPRRFVRIARGRLNCRINSSHCVALTTDKRSLYCGGHLTHLEGTTMMKLLISSRLRLVGLALASVLTIAALATPSKAVNGDWTGCGEPYYLYIPHCVLWGWYCWDEVQACADCDQGRACFAT